MLTFLQAFLLSFFGDALLLGWGDLELCLELGCDIIFEVGGVDDRVFEEEEVCSKVTVLILGSPGVNFRIGVGFVLDLRAGAIGLLIF